MLMLSLLKMNIENNIIIINHEEAIIGLWSMDNMYPL